MTIILLVQLMLTWTNDERSALLIEITLHFTVLHASEHRLENTGNKSRLDVFTICKRIQSTVKKLFANLFLSVYKKTVKCFRNIISM